MSFKEIFLHENEIKNPTHVKPFHIPYLCELYENFYDIFITAKADGVRKILEDNSKRIYESEKVGDIFYIYNILTVLRHHTTNNDKIKYMETINNIKILVDVYNTNDILNNQIPENKSKFQFKTVFKINKKHTPNFNEVLNILQNNSMVAYPTDGWIVFSDKLFVPLKFKPLEHMTIDVKYQSGTFYAKFDQMLDAKSFVFPESDGLWKFLYDRNTKMWMPIQKRDDKDNGNNETIINLIESDVTTNWKYSDCINLYKKLGHVYYDFKQEDYDKNREISSLLSYYYKTNLMCINNFLKSTDKYFVLDLGCGKSKFHDEIKLKNKNVRYFGIDKDPMNLASNIKCNKGDNNFYLAWGDFTNSVDKMEFFSNVYNKFDNSVDLFLMINTINYTNQTKLINLAETVNYFKRKDSKIIIATYLLDYMNDITISENFYIKHVNNNVYEFRYPWIKEPFKEAIISYEQIKEFANNCSMKIINENKYTNILDSKSIDNKYLDLLLMQRLIVLHCE